MEPPEALGASCKSACRQNHKVMRAMDKREELGKLKGLVKLDGAYLGGARTDSKSRSGRENGQVFVISGASDEERDRPTFAVASPVRSFDNDPLNNWNAPRLSPEGGFFDWYWKLLCFVGYDDRLTQPQGLSCPTLLPSLATPP